MRSPIHAAVSKQGYSNCHVLPKTLALHSTIGITRAHMFGDSGPQSDVDYLPVFSMAPFPNKRI